MDPIELADVIRSLRRSRGRVATFLALVSVEAASAAELATLAGIHRKHVEGIMIGKMPGFQPARSLLALGLARARLSRHGVVYEATDAAFVVAAALPRRAVPRVT